MSEAERITRTFLIEYEVRRRSQAGTVESVKFTTAAAAVALVEAWLRDYKPEYPGQLLEISVLRLETMEP